MKKRVFSIGFLLFCWGIFLLMSFQTKITGKVISETTGSYGNLFGVFVFIIGLILMIVGAEEEKSPNIRVIKTNRFEKLLKKHRESIRQIEAALERIETGESGCLEKLRMGGGLYSTRTGKGGRIIFKQIEGVYHAVDYLGQHDYEKIDPKKYSQVS